MRRHGECDDIDRVLGFVRVGVKCTASIGFFTAGMLDAAGVFGHADLGGIHTEGHGEDDPMRCITWTMSLGLNTESAKFIDLVPSTHDKSITWGRGDIDLTLGAIRDTYSRFTAFDGQAGDTRARIGLGRGCGWRRWHGADVGRDAGRAGAHWSGGILLSLAGHTRE